MSARIAAVATRHTARGKVDDLDAAVAELRELAGHRPDLLAEVAGVALGMAEVGLIALAPKHRAEAKLCIAAGAGPSDVQKWIEVGRKRAAQARMTPYTGASRPNLVPVAPGACS